MKTDADGGKTISEKCREKVLGCHPEMQSPGQRCLVLDQSVTLCIEIYLVDTGRTVLRDPQELSNLPDSLCRPSPDRSGRHRTK